MTTMEEEAEPMEVDHQRDVCSYFQFRVIYLLKDVCQHALASIILRDFKNIGFLKENESRKQNNIPGVNNPTNSSPQYINLDGLTLFEFLKKINSIGKKKREKIAKEDKDKVFQRDFQLNNVKETEVDLEKFKASDMSDDSKRDELVKIFRNYDASFLANILTNYILDYDLSELNDAIGTVKQIRNEESHTGRTGKFSDAQNKFEKLYEAIKQFYNYLKWDLSDLEKKKEIGEIQYFIRLGNLAPTILAWLHKELKDQVTANVDEPFMQRYVMPCIVDTRENTRVIENLEQFLEQTDDLVVLSGPSGIGKSTILNNMAQKFYIKNTMKKYKLVILLDSSDRITKSCDLSDLYKAVEEKIKRSCPNTIDKFGTKDVMLVLETTDDVMFVVNWNVGVIENKLSHFSGKWVVQSHNWSNDSLRQSHIVRVMPLNEILVKKMLQSLLLDTRSYEDVIRLYDTCEYKSLINSPDMVLVFSEIRDKTSLCELLRSYLRKKSSNVKNAESQYKALGRKAFEVIKDNKKEYSGTNDLRDVSPELKTSLFLEKDATHSFGFGNDKVFMHKYRVIEDLLAAEYIACHPNVINEIRVEHMPFFKRVFRFVYARWCEEEKVHKNLPHIEKFLAYYIDVPSEKRKKKKNKKGTNKELDALDADPHFTMADSFTRWSYLISIGEYCNFQTDIMGVICSLLSRKSVWVFKCKFIERDKIEALAKMFHELELKRRITIKIESGSNISTLERMWGMLSKLPRLYNHVSVHIMIMHKPCLQVYNSDLSRLPAQIANLDQALHITKYVGPLVCDSDSVEQFLGCHCMRELEVMDITVYDVNTLSQVLSCGSLPNLKVMIIKVELRSGVIASRVGSLRLRLPILKPDVTFKFSVKYFHDLQILLQMFENPEQLDNMSINGVRIEPNFKLDLSKFTGLKALFIHFNRYAAQSIKREDYTPQLSEEPMDLDQWKYEQQECAKSLLLYQNLILPVSLQRLMFRNAEFCCDSNLYVVQNWRRKDIQRLTLLDSSLSIKGVREVLKDYASQEEDKLSQDLKRHCSTQDDSVLISRLAKNPRLEQEKREDRRKHKPSGKELIITSHLDLCNYCKLFPCKCHNTDKLIHKDDLEDLIQLIVDAYHYELLSLNYCSEIITVRKDMCGDLRVHCPLTGFSDDHLNNLEGNKWLRAFFDSLTLAQSITLTGTDLSLYGSKLVIEKLFDLKKQRYKVDSKDEKSQVVDPFSLSISSSSCCLKSEELQNSDFVQYLKHSDCLKQFKFCSTTDKCSYIKKTLNKCIYVNDKSIT